jgi:immunity protein 10 of polymorphic toxin system
MPITFHASHIDTSEEEGLTRVLLSVDSDLAAERYLMFQRDQTPSPDQVRHGMDDIYIETCGQGWSWYGHVRSVHLSRTGITVQLDAAAAAEIGDNGRIDVTFDLGANGFDALRTTLRRVFTGRAYYTEAAA